ncbi:MAG TPA: hypothetical protein VMT22_00960 [Terriglobales bacterium]|jgi:predicted RNA-binding Zn-ribbon protein involved in translation (DUF1610 family)|nr:hypothetical protein [Terriglobales bacterium]
MAICTHATLELLPEPKSKLRCQRCNLTITAEDLGDGFCPECFESGGVKNFEFSPVSKLAEPVVRYRCEACGAIIASR